MIRFAMTRSSGANFITATVSSRTDKHIDDLFDDSLWHRNVDVALHGALLDPLLRNGSQGPPGNKRELRLRTTVFV